jgi:hypothetical protein
VMVDGANPVIGHLRPGARVLSVKRPARPHKRRHARAPSKRRHVRAAAPKRRPPPRATTVRFTLTEPAAVTFAVDRARRGRRSSPTARCKLRARTGRRCLIWSRVRSIDHAGAAGENAIRLRSRGLRPGMFRLVLNAVDGVGNASAPRMAPFRVVPKPRKPAARP